MRFRLTKKLEKLYTEEKGARKYPKEVKDERDLYALKGLHFEKLSGKRKGERSVRLTGQWRLIIEFQAGKQGKYLLIKEIVDYH